MSVLHYTEHVSKQTWVQNVFGQFNLKVNLNWLPTFLPSSNSESQNQQTFHRQLTCLLIPYGHRLAFRRQEFRHSSVIEILWISRWLQVSLPYLYLCEMFLIELPLSMQWTTLALFLSLLLPDLISSFPYHTLPYLWRNERKEKEERCGTNCSLISHSCLNCGNFLLVPVSCAPSLCSSLRIAFSLQSPSTSSFARSFARSTLTHSASRGKEETTISFSLSFIISHICRYRSPSSSGRKNKVQEKEWTKFLLHSECNQMQERKKIWTHVRSTWSVRYLPHLQLVNLFVSDER